MHIPLPIHLSIHFILAVLAGYLVGRHFKKVRLGLIGGIIGGFFIDIDHILEYLFAFGNFNLVYFFQGRQFLVSNRMLLIFHAWEYIPVMIIIIYLVRHYRKLKIFLIALTFGATVHLITDCFINSYPPRNYSIIYRASRGFSADKLLNPEQKEFNEQLRGYLEI